MSNTLSRVPYEKTARQKRIAKRLESLAAGYWQQGEDLLHVLQALVDADAKDASKFRDACAAVGTVLVSAGLAELPAQWGDGFLKNADARFNACWAICDLLDAALNPDGERFEETYGWIMAEARSKPYFQDSLISLSHCLMVERYRPIARDCRARAKLIADESGESLIGLLGAPYSRNQGQDFLTKPAVRALQDWEELNGGGGVRDGESGDLYGFPVGKAKPPMPTGIEDLRPFLDEDQRDIVDRLRGAWERLCDESLVEGNDVDDLKTRSTESNAEVSIVIEKLRVTRKHLHCCDDYLAMADAEFTVEIPGQAGAPARRIEEFVSGNSVNIRVSDDASRLKRLIESYLSWLTLAARRRQILGAGQQLDELAMRELVLAVAASKPTPKGRPTEYDPKDDEIMGDAWNIFSISGTKVDFCKEFPQYGLTVVALDKLLNRRSKAKSRARTKAGRKNL